MILVSAGAPLGLATGLCAWVLAGGAHAGLERLAPISDDLARRPAAHTTASSAYAPSTADLIVQPIFATPEGQVAEPSLRLVGVSVTAQRAAALIEIAGRPAEWLRVGEARDGVTVQQVLANRVALDLASGPRELALGETYAGSGAPAAAAAPSSAATGDRPPPAGMRMPPPPASAPGAR